MAGADASTEAALAETLAAAGLPYLDGGPAPMPNAEAVAAAVLDRTGRVVVASPAFAALQAEGLTPAAVRRVRWRTPQARACADRASDQSDSGLETILAVRLTPWGLRMRQQVVLLGRPVDLLIGERLVIQVDGFAHHSTPAQRGKDVAFDAELVLMGYTVLRFTYAQVMHDWPTVERTIARAIAAGAHLA